ncbi:PAS domain S-box protein [Leeuwenhoekiella sp. A2]|uniref:PAS domain S-box protein n=1 Tax=Leeuwenhoekiella sp. A2 TaxID=3141460 RepID=UPI003A7F65EA
MQQSEQIHILERALAREKEARKAAEHILEQKSTELYELSLALQSSNDRLKELLSEKTSELEGVFINISDAYVVIDLNGNVLKMNDTAIKMLGYNHNLELINLNDLVKKEFKEYTRLAFKKLVEEGHFSNYQAHIITKSGAEKTVQINASIIHNKEGAPIAAQGIARDITQETRLKQELEEQKKQLNIIVENSPIGIALSDENETGLVMVNNALCNMLGYDKDEFKDLQVQDLTHPDDIEISAVNRDKLYKGESDTFTLEKRYITKHKNVVWAKTSVTAVREKSGKIKYQLGTIEDVTKEKLAKDKLRESENRLSTIIVNLQTGILLEDENGRVLLTNTQFCHYFNLKASPDDLKNSDCTCNADQIKYFYADPEQFLFRVNELIQNKEIVIAEELELADGRFFERSFIPLHNEGIYKGHLWSYEDVTIKKNHKENLRAQKDKYSGIIANMNLGLVEQDNANNVLLVNQSFCDITGYNESELLGQNIRKMLLGGNVKDVPSQVIDDTWEVEIITKSKAIKRLLVSKTLNYDVNNNVIGSTGICLDITEQKNLELQKEALLQSLELQNEQLNDYAHIVSHDLKSPLRSISALLSWTKEDFKDQLGIEGLKNLNLVEDKVEKMDSLIENILEYSSIDKSNLNDTELDLNLLITNIQDMIYVPDHIEISIENRLPIITADATRIQQLFQNLITNAVKHIDKPKGEIKIDHTQDENHYTFSIQDNGVGIPAEYHEKIFKMFNSLSTTEKSTGIGLSIVKKVIELYEGEIWLESEVNVGTTFFFTLKR